jgi:predicted transcriptional regulator
MYQDRTHLRDQEIKVRFDEATKRAVDALANLTRKQPAVFVRDLVTAEIRRRLEESAKDAAVGSL